jgi:putative transposase
MAKVKALTELTVADLWKEVKSEEEWWGDINRRAQGMLKILMESSLEEELLEQLQASRYRRTELRKGYRNGYYTRSLYTRFGVIKSLQVPRSREVYESKILTRYQRRQEEVDDMVRNMFLAGVSTRRVGEILGCIEGDRISAQTVSRITRSLDKEVTAYHRRSLVDKYLYLFFDGIVLKVKGALKVQKRPVLTVYGITGGGKREIIDFRQSSSESESQWEAFLRNLYNRGLEGSRCQLIVTDGCAGLHRALETVYPYISRQRCWVHKLRNVAARLRRRDQEECLAGARLIYLAANRRDAVSAFRNWRERWSVLYSQAVNCIEKDLDELLNFMNCPPTHRIKVRTTNVIERSFREVRRRTRSMSCFTNESSVDRIIYGVMSYLNNSWKDKLLIEFTQLY